uniref:(California timema) hypothetical protein n=1 Tax=Timema californicum TaxID=61474 RepID=A0A7R9J5D3_TIMCA|nr:unnamed protein product [Timema californicum]
MNKNGALRRKLQSKVEAVLILSKELDHYRTERDQFKLMAEQLQDRYTALKKISHNMGQGRSSIFHEDGLVTEKFGRSLSQLLDESRERNKDLCIHLEDLRQKLADAQGDLKVLRSQKHKSRPSSGENTLFPSHQREELVQQLETTNLKLQWDLQAVIDEKEELVTERDAYKCKVHRLNHELNSLLKSDNSPLVDIDTLVMENRYLQERLQQAEEEREMANQALGKYKVRLGARHKQLLDWSTRKRDNRAQTGSRGGKEDQPDESDEMIYDIVEKESPSMGGLMLPETFIEVDKVPAGPFPTVQLHNIYTPPQIPPIVQQLLERGTSSQLPNTAATLAHMKSLCLGLLEALGDKSLALSHQKKTNKILAGRISELEQRLESAQGCRVGVFPAQLLLEGYTGSEVDKDVTKMFEDTGQDKESKRVSFKAEDVSEDTDKEPCKAQTPTARSALDSKKHSAKTPNQNTGNYFNSLVSIQHLSGDSLPPQLEQLVQRALEDIRLEAQANKRKILDSGSLPAAALAHK